MIRGGGDQQAAGAKRRECRSGLFTGGAAVLDDLRAQPWLPSEQPPSPISLCAQLRFIEHRRAQLAAAFDA